MFRVFISVTVGIIAAGGMWWCYLVGKCHQKAINEANHKREPENTRDIWGFADDFSHADIGMASFDASNLTSDDKENNQLVSRFIKTFADDVTILENGRYGYTCYREFNPDDRNPKPKD